MKIEPEIENKSPEMKKTAFRRRLQRPRVNKKIAMARRPDAAVKQAILGADRSKKTNQYYFNPQKKITYMPQL